MDTIPKHIDVPSGTVEKESYPFSVAIFPFHSHDRLLAVIIYDTTMACVTNRICKHCKKVDWIKTAPRPIVTAIKSRITLIQMDTTKARPTELSSHKYLKFSISVTVTVNTFATFAKYEFSLAAPTLSDVFANRETEGCFERATLPFSEMPLTRAAR